MTTHRHRKSTEFVVSVDEAGRIEVPGSMIDEFKGAKVHVRLSPLHLTTELKRRGVNEDEVELISAVQLETREQVVKFLLSEGALREDKSFVGRARMALRK